MNTILEIVMFITTMLAVGLGIGFLVSRYKRRYLLGIFKDASTAKPDKEVEIERIRAADRVAARELYERVVREKLDVIKTALAMGYNQQEIDQLDARLEQLIGTDKLTEILDGQAAPTPSGELLDADLTQELRALKQAAQQRQEG